MPKLAGQYGLGHTILLSYHPEEVVGRPTTWSYECDCKFMVVKLLGMSLDCSIIAINDSRSGLCSLTVFEMKMSSVDDTVREH
jgi:hypothetical protein